MAEPKTKPTNASVSAFLKTVTDEQKREDALKIVQMMRAATKEEPVMWGSSIIGFGSYRYQAQNGHENEWPIVGLSPRKQNLAVYIMPGFAEFEDQLAKLGKHTTGASCLYIKRLSDIHEPTLKTIIARSVAAMKKKYKAG